jgi:hypothetical protein
MIRTKKVQKTKRPDAAQALALIQKLENFVDGRVAHRTNLRFIRGEV